MSSAEVALDSSPELGNDDAGVLNQFVQLCRGAQTKSLVLILCQALAHPNTFVFGELLELDSVQQLKSSATEHQIWFNLLQLFATGTYPEYRKAEPDHFPPLSDVLTKKLKMLTVAEHAAKNNSLDYSFLLEQLDIASIRELEDLIIDCMYAGLISGKMDQVNRRLRIEGAMGRDLAPGDVESMLGQLEKWIYSSERLLEQLNDSVGVAMEQRSLDNAKEVQVRQQQLDVKTAIEANKRHGNDSGRSGSGGPGAWR